MEEKWEIPLTRKYLPAKRQIPNMSSVVRRAPSAGHRYERYTRWDRYRTGSPGVPMYSERNWELKEKTGDWLW